MNLISPKLAFLITSLTIDLIKALYDSCNSTEAEFKL